MAKSGVLFRRATKTKLIQEPPLVGELVYATDTNEHGWLDVYGNLKWGNLSDSVRPQITYGLKQFFIDSYNENNGSITQFVYAYDTDEHGWVDKYDNLVWKQLNLVYTGAAENIEVESEVFTGQLKTVTEDYNTVQKALKKLDEFTEIIPVSSVIGVDTSSFSGNLSGQNGEIKLRISSVLDALNEIDEMEIGDKNPILGVGDWSKNLAGRTTLREALYSLDTLIIGDKNTEILNSDFVRNLSGQTFNNVQDVFKFLDTLDFGRTPTGLEYQEVNGKRGFRVADEVIHNHLYGEIGDLAIDLSIAYGMDENVTHPVPAVLGATGDRSIAFGNDVIASGYSSTCIGDTSKAIGNSSVLIGAKSQGQGHNSTVIGNFNEANGNSTVVIGNYLKADNENSFVLGRYNKGDANKILEIGNGTNNVLRTNALSIDIDGTASLESCDMVDIVKPKDITTLEYTTDAIVKGPALNSERNGSNSSAFGNGIIVNSDNGLGVGQFSEGNANNIFEIGVGSSDGNRFNGLEVSVDGVVSANSMDNTEITDDKNLITKGYFDFTIPSFIDGLVTLTENSKTGYLLANHDPLNYGELGDHSITMAYSGNPSVTLGAIGDYSLSFGENTTALRNHSSAFGIWNEGNADSLFEVGLGTDSNNTKNVLDVKENGQILAPLNDITEITDAKSLVTLEYFDANSSATALETVVDVTNFDKNLSAIDTDVQKALETINGLNLTDSDDFIDRALEYANVTNIVYDASGNATTTYYIHLGEAYYSNYFYNGTQLVKVEYFRNGSPSTLLLSIEYGYVNGKLTTVTRT